MSITAPLLALYWAEHNTLHADIIIRLGGRCIIADSYWLSHAGPHRSLDAAKQHYHALWRDAARELESLADGGTLFLPVAFEDQSTAWIRFERIREHVEATLGWNTDEAPVALGRTERFPTQLATWSPEEDSVLKAPSEELVACLRLVGDHCSRPGPAW